MNREQIVPAPTCPDPRDLSAFNRGRLPLDKLESIAEHLSGCARCESSLQALPNEDTILSHLRRDPPELSVVDESACVQLASRARAIPLEWVGTPTVSNATAASVLAGPRLPAVFGAYLLVEQLGQGGMGIVYKAQQQSLKRPVALKLVRAGVYASAEERARFHREGEAIARVQHPHVVQIHEFSEADGQLFFSMELLEGGTLADKLNGQPLPPRQAAELVQALARAVHAAHQQGVVHRDLKPGNVLFASDGTVKITDFGLAKVLDGGDSDTQSDAILGTPAYMAPEQARGEIRAVGPLADVYALGAILYETLTGRPPFQAATRLQTLEQVRLREPEPPSRRRPDVARDLEAICLKCLEKEPGRRYPSASELADDLDRWLGGEPTRVRPARRLARAWRTVCRHPQFSTTVALVALVACLLPVMLFLRDPDRKVQQLEASFHRGEALTLIGEKGEPAWSTWGLRQGMAGPSPLGDKTFSVSSLDPAVLILLRDPRENYRYSAEVRHEDDIRDARVGLCFAYSRHTTAQGPQHCLCTLTFNDFTPLAPDPNTGKMSSRVVFAVQRLPETTFLSIHEMTVAHFVPAAVASPAQFPWRRLAVEVCPDGIQTFWEGKPAIRVPRQQIRDLFAGLKLERLENHAVDRFPDLQPAFAPSDAIGLFLYHGRASFRNVRIEPLAQP